MNFMLSVTPWTLLCEEKREHLQGKGELLSPRGEQSQERQAVLTDSTQ